MSVTMTDPTTYARLIGTRLPTLRDLLAHPSAPLELPPGVLPALEAYAQTARTIDEQPFTEAHKAKQFTEAFQTVQAQVETALQLARDAALKAFDADEGQARAEARETIAIDDSVTDRKTRELLLERVQRSERTQRLAIDLGELAQADALGIEELVEEALLADEGYTIRRLGSAALRRLAALETADRQAANPEDRPSEHPHSAVFVRRRVEARLAAWRRDHPTPLERIRRAQAGRETADRRLTHEVEKALRIVFPTGR